MKNRLKKINKKQRKINNKRLNTNKYYEKN